MGAVGAGGYGRAWPELPFLWAESYFYRRLLEATGYFADGPWHGLDFFAPFKDAELEGRGFAGDLAALDDLAALTQEEREHRLLTAAVWGNQADLGFTIAGEQGSAPEPSGTYVADESDRLWPLLDGGQVVVVADNSAREILADLALIDHLLATGRAGRVELMLKPRPYFVSDATPATC